MLESRLVLRSTQSARDKKPPPSPDKLCIYVSSQAGCNMGCGECHLTATQQTSMRPATPRDYACQVQRVIDEWKDTLALSTDQTKLKIRQINIEFMARGEPLMNPHVRNKWPEVVAAIAEPLKFLKQGITVKYNLSTIMPKQKPTLPMHTFLLPIDTHQWPNLYYSAWSIRPTFKNKWMPSAMPTMEALHQLAVYQRTMQRYYGNANFGLDKVKLHGAFVYGENDSLEDVKELVGSMQIAKLHARFNVIRYNPPIVGPFSQYKETTDERRAAIVDWLRQNNPGGVKEIARVGVDVFASCGTFFH